MNTKMLVPGVCVVGVVSVVIESIKRSEAQATYSEEIDKLNVIPSGNHGQRDIVALNAAIIREKMDPEKTKRHNEEIMLAVKSKSLDGQIKHFRKALEIDPENDMTMENLADALISIGRKDEAKRLYKKVIETSKIKDRISVAKGMLHMLNQ